MGEDGGREDGEEGDGEREEAWREEGDMLRSMAGGVKQDPGRSCEEGRDSRLEIRDKSGSYYICHSAASHGFTAFPRVFHSILMQADPRKTSLFYSAVAGGGPAGSALSCAGILWCLIYKSIHCNRASSSNCFFQNI